MLELAGEVQETLGRAYGLPEDVDEEDLEAGVYVFVCVCCVCVCMCRVCDVCFTYHQSSFLVSLPICWPFCRAGGFGR